LLLALAVLRLAARQLRGGLLLGLLRRRGGLLPGLLGFLARALALGGGFLLGLLDRLEPRLLGFLLGLLDCLEPRLLGLLALRLGLGLALPELLLLALELGLELCLFLGELLLGLGFPARRLLGFLLLLL